MIIRKTIISNPDLIFSFLELGFELERYYDEEKKDCVIMMLPKEDTYPNVFEIHVYENELVSIFSYNDRLTVSIEELPYELINGIKNYNAEKISGYIFSLIPTRLVKRKTVNKK
jgi:hypothetical protein